MHELVEAMANMQEDEALKIVDDMLAQGEDPGKILDLSSEAMQVVGTRYQEGEVLPARTIHEWRDAAQDR